MSCSSDAPTGLLHLAVPS